MLGWPQATCVSAAELQGDELFVTREIEGGQEQLALTLPAVITADLRLAAARFVSLPGMMRARRQPLELLSAFELADDIEPRFVDIAHTQLIQGNSVLAADQSLHQFGTIGAARADDCQFDSHTPPPE